MGIALLDSSTVVGFLDADDALHHSSDRSLRAAAEHHDFAASVVTVAELLTGAKLGHHDEATVRSFFETVIVHRLVLDQPAAERTAALRAANRSLKLPDALILATGDLRADVIITADRSWLKIRGLRCEVRHLAGH